MLSSHYRSITFTLHLKGVRSGVAVTESENKLGHVLKHLSGLQLCPGVHSGQCLSPAHRSGTGPGTLWALPPAPAPTKPGSVFWHAGVQSGLAPLKASHFLSKLPTPILVQRLLTAKVERYKSSWQNWKLWQGRRLHCVLSFIKKCNLRFSSCPSLFQ